MDTSWVTPVLAYILTGGLVGIGFSVAFFGVKQWFEKQK